MRRATARGVTVVLVSWKLLLASSRPIAPTDVNIVSRHLGSLVLKHFCDPDLDDRLPGDTQPLRLPIE